MHVTFVSTYPPRACGLATFTQDLRRATLSADAQAESAVVAMERQAGYAERLPEVVSAIAQDDEAAYASAAAYVSGTGTDVVSIQHEFGIFGGPDGRHVLRFAERVDRPVVTTFHTVLPTPSDGQRRTLAALAERSDRLVVMNETARRLLTSVYGVPPGRIRVVPHGTPTFAGPEVDEAEKERLGLGGRTVLLTFGLLGPSKGIEFALGSLQPVVEANPDALYVVLGATHPEIVRQHGEAYREGLVRQVEAAGLAEHVRFVDEYVDTERLCAYLRATDAYVSPYPGMDQITSGTLAYAVGAGRPIVATPYLHAREALADGRGRLVPFGDTAGFGSALAELASDPALRMDLGARTFAYGQPSQWAHVGRSFGEVLAEVAGHPRGLAPDGPTRVHPAAPDAAFDHLARLTDDAGIVQHAALGVPDRANGYCTDDAARALVAALRYARSPHAADAARAFGLAEGYLAFLLHAQRSDGRFHNFMSFGREWLPHKGDDEDTLGRALWGLGAAVALAPPPQARLARQMMERAIGPDLTHPRAIAYAACGWAHYLDRFPGARSAQEQLLHYATRLTEHHARAANPGWDWFEEHLTYANAKLPEALLRAGRALHNADFQTLGLRTLRFFVEETFDEAAAPGHFDFVGNALPGYRRGGEKPAFDQQPIEAGYTADVCALAFAATGQREWARRAVAAAEWFCGRNRLGLWLYDPATGACHDGLQPSGVNLNQGAESAIACLLGFLAAREVAAAEALAAPDHASARAAGASATGRS